MFGTDGIRAPFGEPPLDRPTVTALGMELAAALCERRGGSPRVVLGGDTRESTPEICRWLAEGLGAGGAALRYAGVVPTPGVAWLVRRLGAAAGVVVSASHNPYPDNGIKLIDAQGFKWSEAAEAALERRLRTALGRDPAPSDGSLGRDPVPPSDGSLGRDPVPSDGSLGRDPAPSDGLPRRAQPLACELTAEGELQESYLRYLAGSVPSSAVAAAHGPPPAGGEPGGRLGGDASGHRQPLAGLHVVLDTGNGAASAYAGELFRRLGARTTVLSAAPDGRNVNLDCGSTAPEKVAAATLAAGADLGAAFDGDADRCIMADERGEVRDGDATLYLWATSLHRAGRLHPPRIVATSMSNLGLERAAACAGIEVVRCGVGDRSVVEAMLSEGIRLGGEQSGHLVHLGLSSTGDGLLTAVQIACLVRQARQPLSALLAGFRRYPQVLLNVPVARKPELANLPRVAAAARSVEERLGHDGRLVLRYSGTEPLARVMIEGPDQAEIEGMARELAAVIGEELRA
ncbi:MAG TPA: phosphoglucosamine mutase [Thermoanaerobaculia bacterium]|nr:phosphoglucosamine mutase [Thermoanaerobaculia bacterium]